MGHSASADDSDSAAKIRRATRLIPAAIVRRQKFAGFVATYSRRAQSATIGKVAWHTAVAPVGGASGPRIICPVPCELLNGDVAYQSSGRRERLAETSEQSTIQRSLDSEQKQSDASDCKAWMNLKIGKNPSR